MTSMIEPWRRPAFRPTGREASIMLVAFAGSNVLEAAGGLQLRGTVPASAPVAALDLRQHRYADSGDWLDRWRTGALRDAAAQQQVDLDSLDHADTAYSVTVTVADPTDLTHLQLAWAVAAGIVAAGAFAVFDAYAAAWLPGHAVAALAPDRQFAIHREISVVAETEPTPGFGHPVHTRGMIKFGRPELVAGVPADRITETGRLLNRLAAMMAEGHRLAPGQRLHVDGAHREMTVTSYTPDGATPDLELTADALLLVDD